ncbi:MAG: TIGR03862 family flavoprotein [Methylocystis sp.]
MIGAGPAGLVAADVLSRAGALVTVFDHKPSPARKFLMAGRGGLNLTHSEPLDIFLTRYGAAAGRLKPIFGAFPPERLRDFCAELGEETYVGTSGRVFPKSFKASPLLRALLARLTQQGVRFERAAFEGFVGDDALSMRGSAGGTHTLAPDAAVFALGGASWPRLGSDGGWTRTFEAMGVAITPLAPANCGALIRWSEHFQGAFEGQPIKTILVRHGGATARGDLVVTRVGLEGGPAYALASGLRAEIERGGGATLSVDLRPDASAAELARRLERERGKQSQATFLRKALKLAKIETALLREARPKGLPRESEALAELIKNIPLAVTGVAGFERAISTSGGVSFDELDASLMLKRRPGVFLAGEMLDFDAPTGGYLLQAAFSTGFVAGQGAARFLGLAP